MTQFFKDIAQFQVDFFFKKDALKYLLRRPAVIDHGLEMQQKHINSDINEYPIVRKAPLSRLLRVNRQKVRQYLVALTTEDHHRCLIAGDARLQNKVGDLYPQFLRSLTAERRHDLEVRNYGAEAKLVVVVR